MNLNLLFKRTEYQLMVFLTGTAILILEILATRLFAPYFGNTIFSISSILSVVLLALAIGYFIGGILADRFPSAKIFYLIIMSGGVASYGIYIFDLVLLPKLSEQLSIITGPLVASCLMLFIPCLLLGLLCPFAIKLVSERYPRVGIGRISGEIFFWSTAGSIIGSLLTGFILVPNFPIDSIIITVAILLSLIGCLGLLCQKHKFSDMFKISLLIFFILSISAFPFIFEDKFKTPSGLKILHSSNGLYERIRVFDGEAYGRPARFMEQDRTNSGAIYLDDFKSAYEYADYFEIFRIFKPELNQALILGGGAYIIPQAILKYLTPSGVVDVAEIEPELLELGKKYFGVSNDSRLQNHLIDGRLFFKKNQKHYDLIFCDVYRSLYSMPSHFTTNEFFEEAKSKLANNGLLLTNIIGNLKKTKKSFTYSLIRTIKNVFPNTIFIVLNDTKSEEFQNIIAISTQSKIDASELIQRQWDYLKEKHFEEKIIKINNQELQRYQLLTDKFSPVDYLISMSF